MTGEGRKGKKRKCKGESVEMMVRVKFCEYKVVSTGLNWESASSMEVVVV